MVQNSSKKNFSYLIVGRVVGLFIQALFYLIFAVIFEPEQYGELNVIIALAGAFATVSRFGTALTIQVYQSKKKSESIDQIKIIFVISTGVGALILLSYNVFASIPCIGISLFIMYQQELLGLKEYKKHMINSLLRGGLFLTIPLLLYFMFDIPGIVFKLSYKFQKSKEWSMESNNSHKMPLKRFIQFAYMEEPKWATLCTIFLISRNMNKLLIHTKHWHFSISSFDIFYKNSECLYRIAIFSSFKDIMCYLNLFSH